MAKFDLKKVILENKATFFGSLTEGQFSWFTQDTDQQIGSEPENTLPFVYMHDNKGNKWLEKDYEGYGVFGGKDYYELLDQMNGGDGDRERGIDLAFDKEAVEAGKVLFPALTVSSTLPSYHSFNEAPKDDPNQSWYTPEEDDYYDQNDDDEDYNRYGDEDEEELDEIKEIKPTTKMKKSELKAKIKEMIVAEIALDIDNMEDAPESEVDFLAELEGMLDEAEGLSPLQQYIYDYESDVSGEDQAQEYLDDIKKLNTPDDVYDYYAYKRDWQGSMDDDLENIYKQVKRKFKNLSEADETEKDTAEDVTIDDTETIDTETTTEVDPNVKAVQDALTQAQAAAQKLGDPKLTDQIGNTITFFTRAHVVEKGAVAEADEMEEGKKEDLNEANSLEKNLIKNITKYLKKRNPTFPEDIIIKKVSSWLNQGKNLMTATNAMGDDFKKDVLNPIESSLTEAKSEDSHPDYNLNSGKKLHPVVKSLTFDSEEELQNYLKNKSKSSKSMSEAKSEDKVINESMFPMLKKILK